MIKIFADLEEPKEHSKKHGTWSVRSTGKLNGNNLYLLNTGMGLDCPKRKDKAGNRNKFGFGSESEAHKVAHAYYEKHNKLYPHVAKWINCQPIVTYSTAVVNDVESQVMEF